MEETTKRPYGSAVLITNWQRKREADPKDFDAFCPIGGSLHRSTYNRLGSYNPPEFPISTTRHMQEQIKGYAGPHYNKSPFINFTSFPCIDTPERHKDQANSGIAEYPKNYGDMDYKTSMQLSYQKPFKNMPATPLMIADPPYLLNQRLRSEFPPPDCVLIVPNKYGIRMFDDDDVFDSDPSRDRAAELRRLRLSSYNPGTGRYQNEPLPPHYDPCSL